MAELPPPLKTACIANDLPLVQTLYTTLLHSDPTTKLPLLTQIAELSAKHTHPSLLSFCFSSGLTLDSERTKYRLLWASLDPGSVDTFRLLLDHGLEVDFFDEVIGTPLASACSHDNIPLATLLLDRGANPDCGYPHGQYDAFVWSIIDADESDPHALDMVRLFLSRGVTVKGNGALVAAAQEGKIEAVRLLLEHGERTGDLDLEETGDFLVGIWAEPQPEGTALYKAAMNGHTDIVDLLFRKGADPEFEDENGVSVMEIAEQNRHLRIAGMLRMAVV